MLQLGRRRKGWRRYQEKEERGDEEMGVGEGKEGKGGKESEKGGGGGGVFSIAKVSGGWALRESTSECEKTQGYVNC